MYPADAAPGDRLAAATEEQIAEAKSGSDRLRRSSIPCQPRQIRRENGDRQGPQAELNGERPSTFLGVQRPNGVAIVHRARLPPLFRLGVTVGSSRNLAAWSPFDDYCRARLRRTRAGRIAESSHRRLPDCNPDGADGPSADGQKLCWRPHGSCGLPSLRPVRGVGPGGAGRGGQGDIPLVQSPLRCSACGKTGHQIKVLGRSYGLAE